MQWPIYSGGRTKALEQAAAAERSATGKDLDSARADLRLETTRAFWALVTATEAVSVVEESVKRIDAQLGDVRARFDAGFLPPNDVLTVDSRVSQQRTLLIQARTSETARAPNSRGSWARPSMPASKWTRSLADANPPNRRQPADPPTVDSAQPARPDAAPTGRPLRCGSKRPRARWRRPARTPSRPLRWSRLRLRAPEHEDLPARRRLGRLVGPRRQRHLHVVERRAHRRAGGRGASSGRGRARASGRSRHPDRARRPSAAARSRIGAIAGGNRRRPLFEAPRKPVASSPSASRPAWRRAPICSTPRSISCRPSSNAPARWPT